MSLIKWTVGLGGIIETKQNTITHDRETAVHQSLTHAHIYKARTSDGEEGVDGVVYTFVVQFHIRQLRADRNARHAPAKNTWLYINALNHVSLQDHTWKRDTEASWRTPPNAWAHTCTDAFYTTQSIQTRQPVEYIVMLKSWMVDNAWTIFLNGGLQLCLVNKKNNKQTTDHVQKGPCPKRLNGTWPCPCPCPCPWQNLMLTHRRCICTLQSNRR